MSEGTYTITRRVIEEQVVPGMRLGRHVHHDSRSLAYLIKPGRGLPTSANHIRETPVLDQGNLGSCTGNAATGVLGSDPFFATLENKIKTGLKLDEAEALALYSAATTLDPYQGTYPPTDTGSDGLSVAKAAKSAGLISGYQHITSLQAAKTALVDVPIITGVNWYDSFDSPDSSGRVTISKGAQVRGGHEFEIYGYDDTMKVMWAFNSWGPNWGLNGMFLFSYDDYSRLLAEQGDATAFVPLTQPAPTPTPTPSKPSFDNFPMGDVQPWLDLPHVYRRSTAAAHAIKGWLNS